MHAKSRIKFIINAGTASIAALVLKACSFNSESQIEQIDTNKPIDSRDEKALYEAAKKEGELLVYMVYYSQEMLNEIGAAFTNKYPGIKFQGNRSTASTLFQKVDQEAKAGLNLADIFATTDIGQMLSLKAEEKLLQYQPAGQENIIEQYQ